MLELYNLGITLEDIKDIYERNPNINEEEAKKLIQILKQIGCNDRMMRNIIITNPFYLTRNPLDIINLINTLSKLGISTLNLLFDTNPYLLNKDSFEIETFIQKKLKNNSLEEIIDMLEENPNIINEE